MFPSKRSNTYKLRTTPSPSSAFLSPVLVGRVPPLKLLQKKMDTLILTSLLEDLVRDSFVEQPGFPELNAGWSDPQ